MPRVFQSHHDDEPERLTAAAARSSEDATRLRADLAASQELAFTMGESHRATAAALEPSVSVGVHSILAQSGHSSSSTDDGAARTSFLAKMASQMLQRLSGASSQSSGYGDAPLSEFNDSRIRSPEFDKISVDSAPLKASQRDGGDASTTTTAAANDYDDDGVMQMSAGPSASAYNGTRRHHHQQHHHHHHQAPPPSRPHGGRARLSSDMSSLQREMDNAAFGVASPVSEATYMQMRKTLDPEALLNGDAAAADGRPRNNTVIGSLRPVGDPFNAPREFNEPGPAFQRGRAATTTALPRPPTLGAAASFRLPGSNRSQRSWTVTGLGVVPPAPVLLARDPRGTFRTTSADTAQMIFASQQVRLQNKWQTDVWIYMKNHHPFLGVCTAHRWHPYKKQDRVLVLLVTLLLAFFLCGLYATQDCCKTVAESSVAVVSPSDSQRFLLDDNEPLSSSRRGVALPRALAEATTCQPFGGACGGATSLCTLGASCSNAQCIPNDRRANTTQCTTNAQCPTGWRCSPTRGTCRPSSSLVCYLPAAAPTASRSVSFAATDDETATTETTTGSSSGSSASAPADAISAIATLIQYAKDNNITTDGSTVVVPTPTATPTATPTPSATNVTTPSPTPTKTPTPTMAAPAVDWNVTSGSGVNKDDAILDPEEMGNGTVEKLLITLTKPTSGGVYTVSSTIPIAWEVTILEGERSFVNTLKFRVDFSRDGQAFDTPLAADIDSDSVLAESPIKYHFDWHLAMNNSLACTNCVLRICTQQQGSAVDQVCIRTDGATTAASSVSSLSSSSSSTSGLPTVASASTASKITFHIVREIVECACGIKHASFVTYSYLLALVFPVAFLVFEQLVTFYADSKVCGLFARRGGPKMPLVGFYAPVATTRGRYLLVVVFVALVFGCGMVVARISFDHLKDATRDVVVLWLLMFLLVLVVGFIYCSAVYCVLFTVRWHQDEKHLVQGFADLNDFAMMLGDSNQTIRQSGPRQAHDPRNHPRGLSYQWPGHITGSSRSNNTFGNATNSSRSNNSTAIVWQRSGQAIV